MITRQHLIRPEPLIREGREIAREAECLAIHEFADLEVERVAVGIGLSLRGAGLHEVV